MGGTKPERPRLKEQDRRHLLSAEPDQASIGSRWKTAYARDWQRPAEGAAMSTMAVRPGYDGSDRVARLRERLGGVRLQAPVAKP
jgi:hypothetical protein